MIRKQAFQLAISKIQLLGSTEIYKNRNDSWELQHNYIIISKLIAGSRTKPFLFEIFGPKLKHSLLRVFIYENIFCN